jgi:accessory gene regulator B
MIKEKLMNIVEKISEKFVRYVKVNFNKNEEEIEIIKYGIQVILINFTKFIILFLTAYCFNIINYCLGAVLIFAILRTFAYGVHADSSLKCIIVNYMVFFGNVGLSLNYLLNTKIVLILFIISFLLIYKYAPADTAERPLLSKKLRKSLKIKASIIVLFLALISILLDKSVYRNIIAYSVLEESLLITPIAYKIFKKPYKNYESIQLKN